jgi:hypothetical protein
MKVLWLFNHPAPYKIDFFNELGKNVELTAIFERTAEGDRPRRSITRKPKTSKKSFFRLSRSAITTMFALASLNS